MNLNVYRGIPDIQWRALFVMCYVQILSINDVNLIKSRISTHGSKFESPHTFTPPRTQQGHSSFVQSVSASTLSHIYSAPFASR